MRDNLILTVPLLHVDSMLEAKRFYCDQLGFECISEYKVRQDAADPSYAVIRRGDTGVHLSSFPGDGKPGGVAVLFVRDVNELFRELTERGVDVDEPVDQTWGNREFYLDDPFGNQLRYTQPLHRSARQ